MQPVYNYYNVCQSPCVASHVVSLKIDEKLTIII